MLLRNEGLSTLQFIFKEEYESKVMTFQPSGRFSRANQLCLKNSKSGFLDSLLLRMFLYRAKVISIYRIGYFRLNLSSKFDM